MPEKEPKREIRIKLPTKIQMMIATAILGVALTAADKSLAAGVQFQIPYTDVHITLGGSLGQKNKLTIPFPPSILSKLGPNANKSDIVNLNTGFNLGTGGVTLIFDIRHSPGDPLLVGGIGTSP
jgi:hypothetical protein